MLVPYAPRRLQTADIYIFVSEDTAIDTGDGAGLAPYRWPISTPDQLKAASMSPR